MTSLKLKVDDDDKLYKLWVSELNYDGKNESLIT